MGDDLDSLLAMMGSGKGADSGGAARTQDGKQQGKQGGKGRKRQRQELHADGGARGAAVASTLPKPSTLWAVKETALAGPQSDTLAVLQRLCRRVFKQQAYWKPADRAPTNVFERLADQVFWQHAEAAHRHKAEKRAKAQKQKQGGGSRDGPKRAAVPALDLSRSGTEWWVQVRGPNVEQGYVTTYNVTGAPTKDFSFLTIRLAGHMVPTFQPASSLAFFQRFLAAEPFAGGPDGDDREL